MAEPTRPRGIRDIAHLYLSRQSRRTQPAAVDLWVVGEDRSCLSGFHAANLAAAFAARKVHVRVFELSGLLPNAAFYFCLPPAVYLGREPASSSEFVQGMNAVSIAFDSVRLMNEPKVRGDVSVNVVHLPPLSASAAFADAAGELVKRGRVERWSIYLSCGRPGVGAEALGPWVDAKAVFELSLDLTPPSLYARRHLGGIPGWRLAVADRIPCVVRNPGSGLSRAYFSVVESLLARVNAVRRRRIDEPRPELTAGGSPRR